MVQLSRFQAQLNSQVGPSVAICGSLEQFEEASNKTIIHCCSLSKFTMYLVICIRQTTLISIFSVLSNRTSRYVPSHFSAVSDNLIWSLSSQLCQTSYSDLYLLSFVRQNISCVCQPSNNSKLSSEKFVKTFKRVIIY